MSKQNELRPQTLKTPRKVEVKTALPWVLIVLMVALAGGFLAGWATRSSYVVTSADVSAQIVEQLAAKK